MAILTTFFTTIQIIPQERRSYKSEYIKTAVILEYHIKNQNMTLEFPNITLTINDFKYLIKGIREYIKTLPARPLYSEDVFMFTPFEIDFLLELSDGFYMNEDYQEGYVTFDFNICLGSLGLRSSGDRIGCTLRINIDTLLVFSNNLEQELNEVLSL